MSSIDFEQDKTKDLASADNAGELSTQVVRLQSLEDQIKDLEMQLKDKKREADKVSGEVKAPKNGITAPMLTTSMIEARSIKINNNKN